MFFKGCPYRVLFKVTLECYKRVLFVPLVTILLGRNKIEQHNYKEMVYRYITIICYCPINLVLLYFVHQMGYEK